MDNMFSRIFGTFILLTLGTMLLGLSTVSWVAAQQRAIEGTTTPGGGVAATPISISHPIRLQQIGMRQQEKVGTEAPKIIGAKPSPSIAVPSRQAMPMMQRYGKKQLLKGVQVKQMHDAITACEYIGLTGKELTVRIYYDVDAARVRPIYVGAWLFGSDGKDVGVGYKPMALPVANQGSADVVMVLPDQPFTSSYMDVFLLSSGKEIVKERYEALYYWDTSRK